MSHWFSPRGSGTEMDSPQFVLAKPGASERLRRSIHRHNRGPESHRLLGLVVLAAMVFTGFNKEIGPQVLIALAVPVSLTQFLTEIFRDLRIKRAIKNSRAVQIKMRFARLWLAELERYGLSDGTNESFDWLTGNSVRFKRFMDAVGAWTKMHESNTGYLCRQLNIKADDDLRKTMTELIFEFDACGRNE